MAAVAWVQNVSYSRALPRTRLLCRPPSLMENWFQWPARSERKLWKWRRLAFGDMEDAEGAFYWQFKSWQTSLDCSANILLKRRKLQMLTCDLYNISMVTMKVGAIWRQLDNYAPFAGYCSKPTYHPAPPPPLDSGTCPIHQVYFKWAHPNPIFQEARWANINQSVQA